MADLKEGRYIESSAVGVDLYQGVAELPIVSPHGHIDARLLAEPAARLDPPGRLFVTTDHYVVRMLHSQGVPLERAGLLSRDADGRDVDDRVVDDHAVWQLLADNAHLFALTPTGLWLRETLATVFGIEEPLGPHTAEAIYVRVEEQLSTPAFAPWALLDRFQVECLSTTDAAGSSLAAHRALAVSEPGFRIRPTFRPDAVVALDAVDWRDALSGLETAADHEVGDYASFLVALAERRAAFKTLGATATDHAAMSADTTRLTHHDASALFAAALTGAVSDADARRFEAHMLNEFARMSMDDGLVMQLHVGALRDHNRPLAARFGRDIGADIPVATDWTRGLRPLLEACGSDPGFALILFTLDESAYSRELAPLAGHYPAVLLGCPWWFHDSPAGIDRFLDRVTETVGLYNLAGFVDDARAVTALPARHDLWRRRTCGWLARKVDAGLLAEEDAHQLAWELAYGLVRRAYRLDS
ncbi:MAG: glucuronate isomerase [Actinobacteria bacterium]|nr:glucuronate isomerase [Actinomycetota bacterium]